MIQKARKLVLPQVVLTETAFESDAVARKIILPASPASPSTSCHIRPEVRSEMASRETAVPDKATQGFPLFPVVVDSGGVPWAEAIIYVIELRDEPFPLAVDTIDKIAADLAAFRQYLDDTHTVWTAFPSHKLSRVTYLYQAHLNVSVAAGEISYSLASRRISTVVQFYRWLIKAGAFCPENPPWVSSDRYIHYRDARGDPRSKRVEVVDVGISVPKQHDPYDDHLVDEGRLRPLPYVEQEWLLDALVSIGNPEMTLIHLVALATGARMQTILTFKVRDFIRDVTGVAQPFIRLPVGHGTDIDTKRGKRMTLHIPAWLYRQLRTYAQSDRARRRRRLAGSDDVDNQYLFLTVRGSPFYVRKSDTPDMKRSYTLRHKKSGQAVRQFIAEKLLPFIRTKHRAPTFHFQFHDTRATFGMNLTDHQLRLVEEGKATLSEVREYVAVRMGHTSTDVTDRYLQFRKNLRHVRHVVKEHESHLQRLSESVMKDIS